MGGDAAPTAIEPMQYLAAERAADTRHELWRGEVFAMTGASWANNVITANLVAALHRGLAGTGCRAVAADLKVHVPRKQGFVYPDVVVVCDPPIFFDDRSDVIENPVLVIEVLSESTERFDRGDKADGYRSIASVREIVLVSQVDRHLEHFERLDDGAWRLRVYEGSVTVALPSLACSLTLDEVYDGLTMP